eukprot:1415942-Pyramimonas_sp.AAC.1
MVQKSEVAERLAEQAASESRASQEARARAAVVDSRQCSRGGGGCRGRLCVALSARPLRRQQLPAQLGKRGLRPPSRIVPM